MLFRFIMICIFLAGLYPGWEIFREMCFYHDLTVPKADFLVRSAKGNHSGLTIVEFVNYDCSFCKKTHLTLLDFMQRHPEINYVVRPVPYANGGAEQAAEYAIAAGLQGKFWEIDKALVDYDAMLDEKFYKDTASVYDIDYGRMVHDSKAEQTQTIVDDNASRVLEANIKTMPALLVGKTLYQLNRGLTETDLLAMIQHEKNR